MMNRYWLAQGREEREPIVDYKHLCVRFTKVSSLVAIAQWAHGLDKEFNSSHSLCLNSDVTHNLHNVQRRMFQAERPS